jgi:hypothetical protein
VKKRKQFSIKGLADYMAATPGRQRTILRHHKYPSEDEAAAKTLYYQPARERIVRHHQHGHPVGWLSDQADRLDEQAAASDSDGRARRLRNNAKALRAYAENFGNRKFEILGPVRLGLRYADVRVSAAPDLHVREKGVEKIIKLEFGAEEPDEITVKVISQGLFEAAQREGFAFRAADVLYLDVPRGKTHRGARLGARLSGDIEATCLNISAIWDTL